MILEAAGNCLARELEQCVDRVGSGVGRTDSGGVPGHERAAGICWALVNGLRRRLRDGEAWKQWR